MNAKIPVTGNSKLATESVAPADPARRTLRHRLRQHGPQFLRYIGVGTFNTLFGYTLFAVFLTLLNRAVPPRFLYLTVILASVLSTPINITVAWLGYKFLVFRTHGNYLREWLKCFAVYGTSMVPGLVALSALTRALQALFHRHSAALHVTLANTESHLSPNTAAALHHANGSAMAGYVAGALVTGFSTIFSFIGHKKVTFHRPPV